MNNFRSLGAFITKIKSPGVRTCFAEAAPKGRKAAIANAKTAINRYVRLILLLPECLWFSLYVEKRLRTPEKIKPNNIDNSMKL
jgi:hypothetical protein